MSLKQASDARGLLLTEGWTSCPTWIASQQPPRKALPDWIGELAPWLAAPRDTHLLLSTLVLAFETMQIAYADAYVSLCRLPPTPAAAMPSCDRLLDSLADIACPRTGLLDGGKIVEHVWVRVVSGSS